MLRNDLYEPWFLEEKKWGFNILSGEFKDVVIEIEKLEFDNKEEGSLAVEYHLINKPIILSDDDVKGDLFKTVFETIVNDIVREAIETLDEKHRDGSSSEPNSQ